MKIALIQPPVWGTREPPLALVQLSGALKARGHTVKSFDLNNHLYKNRGEAHKNLWAWEQSGFWYDAEKVRLYFAENRERVYAFINDVMRFGPALVGFSVARSSWIAAREVARILKTRNASLRIVFGGQMFFDPDALEEALAEPAVDIVIDGEGEEAFAELARSLKQVPEMPVSSLPGSGVRAIQDAKWIPRKLPPEDDPQTEHPLQSVKGLYVKRDGAVHFTGARKPLASLDALAYMDFSDLKKEEYDDSEHLALQTARGCVWNCAFCSSKPFWKGYREMSAERIHQELTFHKLSYPELCHIDFQDLEFNANPRRVNEFCELMLNYPPYGAKMVWVANAIVHPGLTKELLIKMRAAGCKKLIFGLESGSERVLALMGKKYKIADAKRIIKDAHDAGIGVTGNFMFGFPGETEKDFAQTLAFIRATGKYFERVYPSRTYCAIEEFSALHKNPAKYGIRKKTSHHLWWESADGKNTYPVRMNRCQRFEALCRKLKIRIDSGVRTSVEMDEWFNLGHYYEHAGEAKKALSCFKKYKKLDAHNAVVNEIIQTLNPKLEILNKPKTRNRKKDKF